MSSQKTTNHVFKMEEHMDSIIFDLDGTLWDSTEKVAEAWNDMIREHGIYTPNITATLLQSLFGQPLPDIAAVTFADIDRSSQLELLDLCTKREYEFLLRDGSPTYPHLEETLKYLSAKYSLFIVSNCLTGYIEVFLKVTGLDKYFQDHMCQEDTGMSKATNILEIIKRNNLKSPIYVGDTDGDNKASKKAGIPFVFATYGFGKTTNVDYQINDLRDLTKLF